MELTLIKNPDEKKHLVYKIARVAYAETSGASLRGVEALCSMIANYASVSGRTFPDIISDENIFHVLNEKSPRHKNLNVDANKNAFCMCVRVVERMLRGNLPDMCNGATSFHHTDVIPSWATARGYILEQDDMLFYL